MRSTIYHFIIIPFRESRVSFDDTFINGIRFVKTF